jgi:uncharacterized repeat protein (TIGR03803 family)
VGKPRRNIVYSRWQGGESGYTIAVACPKQEEPGDFSPSGDTSMTIKRQLISLLVLIGSFGFLTATTPLFAASKEQVLYSFCPVHGCSDGKVPSAGLITDTSGNFYGTTSDGGVFAGECKLIGEKFSGCGTVFELESHADGKWTEKVLHRFNFSDGASPLASLIFDAAGNLYGTTANGGSGTCIGGTGCGTVFQLTPGNDGKWTEKVLHRFSNNGEDGQSPSGSLIFDASGNLYGTTYNGGTGGCTEFGPGCGTVFQLTPGANGKWTEEVVHSFTGGDGIWPWGLILDASGNLYGAAYLGGSGSEGGAGTAFELMRRANGRWTVKVLYSFCVAERCADGAGPVAGLTFDAAGNLYGATVQGGGISGSPCGYGCGTVFQLAPHANGKWKETVLHRFRGEKDGWAPQTGPIFSAAGKLYGTTGIGGSATCGGAYGCGIVFQLTLGSDGKWTEKVLHSFTGKDGDGDGPSGGLAFDPAGNLYGTTLTGGSSSNCFSIGCGAVFKITQ